MKRFRNERQSTLLNGDGRTIHSSRIRPTSQILQTLSLDWPFPYGFERFDPPNCFEQFQAARTKCIAAQTRPGQSNTIDRFFISCQLSEWTRRLTTASKNFSGSRPDASTVGLKALIQNQRKERQSNKQYFRQLRKTGQRAAPGKSAASVV